MPCPKITPPRPPLADSGRRAFRPASSAGPAFIILLALTAGLGLPGCLTQEETESRVRPQGLEKGRVTLTEALFSGRKKPAPLAGRAGGGPAASPQKAGPGSRTAPDGPDSGPASAGPDGSDLARPPEQLSRDYGFHCPDTPEAGRRNNLGLTVFYQGRPAGRTGFKIRPHPAFLNLKPRLRLTDQNGNYSLKGLLIAPGYQSVPLTLDMGPGLSLVTRTINIRPQPYELKIVKTEPAAGHEGPAGSGAYDLLLQITRDGKPYRGSISFSARKELPNLRRRARPADQAGLVALKGLKVLTPHLQLFGRLDSGRTVSVLLPGGPDPGGQMGAASAALGSDSQNPGGSLFSASPPPGTGEAGKKAEKPDLSPEAARVMNYLTPGPDGRTDPVSKIMSSALDYLGAAVGGRLSPYGRWRFRSSVDSSGRFTGGADYLYPFYETPQTTLFGQGGLAGTNDGRIISHLGLGQRFFPLEETAAGYNLFLDGDLKRAHYRFGAGLELWYRNLKLAGNIYKGLGPWRKSAVYPDWPVYERAADGWDVRAEGYLPFLPAVSVTGGAEKWSGPQVGSFEPQKSSPHHLYSYGLNWSPWPLMTASVTQTRGRGRKSQTSAGISFNLRPGVTAGEYPTRLTPAAFRHDFVSRDYTMPVAYKGVTVHRILLVSSSPDGLYTFKVTDGFGRAAGSLKTRVSVADGRVLISDPHTGLKKTEFMTDLSGQFTVLYYSDHKVATQTEINTGSGRGLFPVSLDGRNEPEPPRPGGSGAFTVLLKEMNSPDFTFELQNENEETVADHRVTAAADGCPVPVFAYQSTRPAADFTTDSRGRFQLSLGPVPGYPEGALNLTPQGGSDKKFRLPLPHSLAMTAGVTDLLPLVPQNVALTMLFNGKPLPEGSEVSLSGPAGAFSGLPETARVSDSLGRIILENLMPLNTGTLTVSSRVKGYFSGQVSFKVAGAGSLSLKADKAQLNYGENTQVTLTVSKDGQPLPAGRTVEIFGPPALAGLPEAAVTSAGGQITLAGLKAESWEAQTVQVRHEGLLSNQVSFNVLPLGHLTLEVSPGSLEFLKPASLNLTVKLNGSPLPGGTEVQITAAGGLTGLPAKALTDISGRINLPQARAGSLGPAVLTVQSQNLRSNEVSLDVWLNPAELTLSVQPERLELLVPADTVFSLKYRGEPLPAGTPVSLSNRENNLSPLPSGLTENGGLIKAPALKAVSPAGPFEVKADLGQTRTAETFIEVFMTDTYLSAQSAARPDVSGLYLDQALIGQTVIDSCRQFEVDLTLTYRGQPLAGIPVTVTGFAYSISGRTVTTSPSGKLTGTLYYTRNDQAAYQAQPDYLITVGGLEVKRTGPAAVNFLACTP